MCFTVKTVQSLKQEAADISQLSCRLFMLEPAHWLIHPYARECNAAGFIFAIILKGKV